LTEIFSFSLPGLADLISVVFAAAASLLLSGSAAKGKAIDKQIAAVIVLNFI
jgi:hypothetical protein